MPLQSSASSSDPLCLSEVRAELGLSSSTRLCLGDSRVRTLAGKPSSGTICLSDLLGKGSAAYTITNTGIYGGGTRLVYYGGADSFSHRGGARAGVARMSKFTFSNDTSSITSIRICVAGFATCNESTSAAWGPCGAHTYSGVNDVSIFNETLFQSTVVNLGDKVFFAPTRTDIIAGQPERVLNLSTLTSQAVGFTIQDGTNLGDRQGVSGIVGYLFGGTKNDFKALLLTNVVDKVRLDNTTSSRISTTCHTHACGAGFGNGSQSFVAGGVINASGWTYDNGTSLTGSISGINHSNDTAISVSSTINKISAGAGLGTSTAGYICGGRVHQNPKQTSRIEQFTYSSRASSTLSNSISRAMWQMGELSSTTSGYLLGGGVHSSAEPGGMGALQFSPGYGGIARDTCDWTGSIFLPPGNRGDIISNEIQKMNYSTRTVSTISTRLTTLQQYGAKGGQSVTATTGTTGW